MQYHLGCSPYLAAIKVTPVDASSLLVDSTIAGMALSYHFPL